MASRSLKDPTRASDEQPAVADGAAPVVAMLAAAARSHGDRTALVHGDRRVTYAELEERVARLAHGLAATGVVPGDPVALVLREGAPFVTSFLAVIGLGAVAVPLNPQYKDAELRFSMSDCGVRAVIAGGERAVACREIVAGWDVPAPVIAADGTDGGGLAVDALIDGHAPIALDGADPDDDAVFQYSAGCTGGAKRVPAHAASAAGGGRQLRRDGRARPGRRHPRDDPAVPQLRHGLLPARGAAQRGDARHPRRVTLRSCCSATTRSGCSSASG